MQRGIARHLILATVFCVGPMLSPAGERIDAEIPSSIDKQAQPCYIILPDGFDADGPPVPLLVGLHSWSYGIEGRRETLEAEAEKLGWLYLFPHFRGRNDNPEACGSLKAQRDILDAVEWAKKNYPVDDRRIYITGGSGGGHMTMLMVGRHPEVWAAASAWVGISDLAAWHSKHDKTRSRYAVMMEKCCGGKPGDSPAIDKQYRERSPLTHLHRAVNVPLDISAGVHDGHKGSVPIRHSLDAFNTIASAAGDKTISEKEIQQLSRANGRLDEPRASDQVEDVSLGREIHLRRTAAKSRVTIFEGGHESIPQAAIAWLRQHAKSE